jgi:hypothetical protein
MLSEVLNRSSIIEAADFIGCDRAKSMQMHLAAKSMNVDVYPLIT